MPDILGMRRNLVGVSISSSILADFHLDHAPKARFDCGDRVACTVGTRLSVLEQIDVWTGLSPGPMSPSRAI